MTLYLIHSHVKYSQLKWYGNFHGRSALKVPLKIHRNLLILIYLTASHSLDKTCRRSMEKQFPLLLIVPDTDFFISLNSEKNILEKTRHKRFYSTVARTHFGKVRFCKTTDKFKVNISLGQGVSRFKGQGRLRPQEMHRMWVLFLSCLHQRCH